MSTLFIQGQFTNNSDRDQREMITLILDGNLYSLSSLILHKLPMLAPNNPGHGHVRQIRFIETLDDRIRFIWRSHGRKRWDTIGVNLRGMWTVRAMMVRSYLRRYPMSALSDTFSMLTQWNGTHTTDVQWVVDNYGLRTGSSGLRARARDVMTERTCGCQIQ